MNKLATALLISVIATVLIGCSSGSSSSPEPQNVTGRYEGSFQNTDNTQNGTAVFNLVQGQNATTITGSALFSVDGRNNICLISGAIENGTITGFNVMLEVNGITFQLATNDGNTTLNGTYVLTGTVEGCSGPTGSGNITLTRA